MPAFAQQTIEGYQLSVGLPEIGNITPGTTLATFFTYLFNLSLVLSGLAGFIALLFGGVLYMTTGIADTKNKAREIIQGAFIGILLLVGTYLILKLINPALTNPTVPTLPAPKSITQLTTQYSLKAGAPCKVAKPTDCLSGVCTPGGVPGNGTCAISELRGRCSGLSDCKSGDGLACDVDNICRRTRGAACSVSDDCVKASPWGGLQCEAGKCQPPSL